MELQDANFRFHVGTSGCRGHVCWGTCECRGHVGVGDMWVWRTCGCRGHVGVGDMRVSGTCGCRGHEGVGDLYSGGLVCLIQKLLSFMYNFVGPAESKKHTGL